MPVTNGARKRTEMVHPRGRRAGYVNWKRVVINYRYTSNVYHDSTSRGMACFSAYATVTYCFYLDPGLHRFTIIKQCPSLSVNLEFYSNLAFTVGYEIN